MKDLAKWVVTLVAAASIEGGAVSAATPSFEPHAVSGADRSTVQKLHDGNQLEIEMGRLAQDKGSTRVVRDLGRRLETDHTLCDHLLDGFLRKRGTDLSALATKSSADVDHEMIATKTHAEFDRAFELQTVADHQKALDLLDSARVETADDTLRMLYDQLTATLRADKRAAEMLLGASAKS